MASHKWPTFADENARFFEDHLRRPRLLFAEFAVTTPGSGRPTGPRDLLWQSVCTSAVAALEAGLEDLVFAAHAARTGCEGAEIERGVNTPSRNPRNWLAEMRLVTPNAQKVERVIFADFGLTLGVLPNSAQFTEMIKAQSNKGGGRGQPNPGPTDWGDLRSFLDCLAYIRNASAHADVGKLDTCPTQCEGSLWLKKNDGTWSVQQPHGLTALRCIVAIYNTIAEALASSLGVRSDLSLTRPDTIDYPP